ncbi:glycosyltransferase family 4 protein [Terasakiella sp. A23]|uniref:glycosyltransferase family 4 protein n=1 Tax=Terasakiella sp. FCG-A23 TaxID=3080561 RepID=UPI0029558D4D|nr:glycosyltransferase family 4 protein [Terasakiella sp. A23]MDV7340827.1 glycosyltransferase family 4 protein [Terasakiella sp. A23]
MKLIYLSPEPERQGHASYTHVHEIINNLKKMDWDIDLYCPRYDEKALPGAVSRLKEIGKTLWRAMRGGKPDAYYMRWHFAAWPLAFWAKLRGVPCVIEINGPVDDLFIAWPITRKAKWLFRWLMESQLKWAAGLVPVTGGLGEVCRKVVGDQKPMSVIPNGANTDQFSPEAAHQENDYTRDLPEKFCIFFGTMAAWQGIRTVLAAVESDTWPKDLPIYLAGDGAERPHVEEVAARQPDLVKYLGRIPYEHLPSLVARAQTSFICTENLEGRGSTGLAPLKLFESLACGVAVVATDMPFQSDVVRNGQCGYIVPAGSPDELAATVNKLVSGADERLEMGKNARRVAVEEHSWYARAKDTHDLLKTVVK